jgi:hypothetical protein
MCKGSYSRTCIINSDCYCIKLVNKSFSTVSKLVPKISEWIGASIPGRASMIRASDIQRNWGWAALLSGLLAIVLLVLLSSESFAIEHHAKHIWKEEKALNGWNCTSAGPQTICWSAINTGDMEGKVIDEIYLRLRFEVGEFASVDQFAKLVCGEKVYGKELFRHSFEQSDHENNLILSYGFVDNDTETIFQNYSNGSGSTNCRWQVVINNSKSGGSLLKSFEVGFTYHENTSAAMPDLYTSASNLLKPSIISGEFRSDRKITGQVIDASIQNIYVLIHDWNPENRFNHFAPLMESDHPLENKWLILYQNLSKRPEVLDGRWDVAMYDWSQDAATGAADLSAIANADYARDAAHAHGLRLGQLLAEGRMLRKVHFIAHGVGSWMARRAADYLRERFGDTITIRITSLDPYVNNSASNSGWNLKPDFELMRKWVDYLENFYVEDYSPILGLSLGSEWFNYTSGDFANWDTNLKINNIANLGEWDSLVQLYHDGPVLWYTQVAISIGNASNAKISDGIPLEINGGSQLVHAADKTRSDKSGIVGVASSDDHGDSFETATDIEVGQILSGQLEASGDLDYFQFTVTQEATYVFYTRGDSGTEGTLYGSAYNFIASDRYRSGELDNFRIVTTLRPGTYYLEVR